MRGVRGFIRWGILLVAVWLVFSAALGIALMEGALHTPRKVLTAEDESRAQAIAERDHASLTNVMVAAADGVMLRGWSLIPRNGNGDAVILLHGQGDNRAGLLENADLLMRHGFAVLMPDSRAHGESGGEILTYGVKEVGDIRRWYGWLEQSEAPHCIYGLGNSMGAAILLEATASEPGFCAVVAESPFSSFRDAAYLRLGQRFDTGPWLGRTVLLPAVEAGLFYARWRYGVNLDQSSPLNAVASSHVPILLIHGLADTNLPPSNSEKIKAANPALALWEPAGAGHCGAISVAPAEYEQQVVGWFESHARAGKIAA